MTADAKSTNSANGWNEWAKRVLHDIERAEENIGELYGKINDAKSDCDRKINDIKIEMAILKTKVALIGTGCGIAAAVAIEVITRLVR
jgi:hypothetical protein